MFSSSCYLFIFPLLYISSWLYSFPVFLSLLLFIYIPVVIFHLLPFIFMLIYLSTVYFPVVIFLYLMLFYLFLNFGIRSITFNFFRSLSLYLCYFSNQSHIFLLNTLLLIYNYSICTFVLSPRMNIQPRINNKSAFHC